MAANSLAKHEFAELGCLAIARGAPVGLLDKLALLASRSLCRLHERPSRARPMSQRKCFASFVERGWWVHEFHRMSTSRPLASR
jgi:hypothetical protein